MHVDEDEGGAEARVVGPDRCVDVGVQSVVHAAVLGTRQFTFGTGTFGTDTIRYPQGPNA